MMLPFPPFMVPKILLKRDMCHISFMVGIFEKRVMLPSMDKSEIQMKADDVELSEGSISECVMASVRKTTGVREQGMSLKR